MVEVVTRSPANPLETGPTRRPLMVHLLSLAAAAVLIVWSARGLQFYYDDWAMVAAINRGEPLWGWLMAPHNEHWILVPKLVFAGLHSLVGFGSVWPYALVTLALHLTLCHLLWRFAVRCGADPWLATIAALGFAVYCAGVENILVAMEMLFVGSMVLGTLTFLELTRGRPRPALVVLWSVLNVMTFSLGPVFVGMAALLIVVQRRWRTLGALVPAAALFVAWRSVQQPASTGTAASVGDLLTLPVYWAMGVGNGVSSIVPWRSAAATPLPGLDPRGALLACVGVVVLVLAVFAGERVHRWRGGAAATVFMLGCPGVVLVTSFSRVDFGLGYAMISRNTYVSTAFLLPFLVVVLSRVSREGGRVRVAVVATALAVALANVVVWGGVGRAWSDLTQRNARVLAAGQELQRQGETLLPEMAATSDFAWLSPADLERLDLSEVSSTVTAVDALDARLAAQTTIERLQVPQDGCSVVADSRIAFAVDDDEGWFRLEHRSDVSFWMRDGHVRSSGKVTTLDAGTYGVRTLSAHGELDLQDLGGSRSLTACSD